MQTIAEREQRYQEELAEQAREVDRLAARKVGVYTNSVPLASVKDATALPRFELVKAACLWLFLHCCPHRADRSYCHAASRLPFLILQDGANLRYSFVPGKVVSVKAHFMMPFHSTQYSVNTG